MIVRMKYKGRQILYTHPEQDLYLDIMITWQHLCNIRDASSNAIFLYMGGENA